MTPTHTSDHNELPRRPRGSFTIPGGAAYAALALLIAALYTILTYLSPYALDDWTFMGIWRDDIPGEGTSPERLLAFHAYISAYDNGRLANTVEPVMCMETPWRQLFPFINGLLTAAVAVMLQRLATGRPDAAKLAATWALMIVALPWQDTIFVTDYSLNYIWSAALTLLLLWLLKGGEGARGRSPLRLGACLVLAVAAGGWHESFATETLCGLGLLCAVRRMRMSAQFYTVAAVYAASTLFFMLTPGMEGRIATSFSPRPHHLPWLYHAAPIALGATLICLSLTPQGRLRIKRQLTDPVSVTAFGIMVAGYAIAMTMANTPRSYFWPNMGAAAIMLRFAAGSLGPGIQPRLKAAAGLTLATGATAITVAVIVWQARYTRVSDEILSLMEESESGSVFYDIPYPEKAPAYTLGIPTDNLWSNWHHYHALTSYMMKPVNGVVPTALRDARLEDGTPAGGDIPGARLYKGLIIAPYRNLNPKYAQKEPALSITTTAELPEGEITTDFLAIPFVNAEGDTLLYFKRIKDLP